MLVLSTLALAADIPVESHVLVRSGASTARRGGGWSAVPAVEGVAWPATVVADLGEELEVRFAADGCVDSLALAGLVDVTVVVREADLHPMVVEPVTGSSPTGASWQVGAGTPVVGSVDGVQVDVGGVTITLPTPVKVGRFTPTLGSVPALSTSAAPGTIARGEGGYGHFRGKPITGNPESLPVVEEEGGTVRWVGRCATFSFDRPSPTFSAREHDLHIMVARAPGTSGLRGGARLSWPDGAYAGGLLHDYWSNRIWLDGGQACVELPLASRRRDGGPTLPLCAPVADLREPETPAPAATVTPGKPSVLGALAPAQVDAAVKVQLAAVNYCYLTELARTPTLEGELTAKFTVGSDGAVTGASVASKPDNERLATCASLMMRRVRFPAPTDGRGAIVVVRFQLRKG